MIPLRQQRQRARVDQSQYWLHLRLRPLRRIEPAIDLAIEGENAVGQAGHDEDARHEQPGITMDQHSDMTCHVYSARFWSAGLRNSQLELLVAVLLDALHG